VSRVYTSLLHFQKKILRDLHYCTNSYKEDAESNCKAPHTTVGAFDGSGFHPLVVNSVGAILSQHAKKSSPLTEKGELPISEHRGTRREDWRTVGKAQARLQK
jgi:hypothetical protein